MRRWRSVISRMPTCCWGNCKKEKTITTRRSRVFAAWMIETASPGCCRGWPAQNAV